MGNSNKKEQTKEENNPFEGNYKIKLENSDEKGTLDDEQMLEYINKAKYSTCQIFMDDNNDNLYGSGFFCRIPYTENNNNLLNVLLTCEHVLKKDIVYSKKDIRIKVNDSIKNISLSKKRKKWSSEELDYSCIEILDDDGIDDYYQLDDIILKKDYSNDLYLNNMKSHIIIFAIMKNKRRGHSIGLIKNKEDHLFAHNCNTYPGCSGGAIVNKNNNCIIGLHRGEIENSKKVKNCGIFIKNIIDNIKHIKQKDINKNDYILSFIGDMNCGSKTSLIEAYYSGKGSDLNTNATVVTDIYFKKIQYLNKESKLFILDNCGQHHLAQLARFGLINKKIDCFILGYDITDYESFQSIERFWIPLYKDCYKKFYLVGNKIDLEEYRKVPKEEAIKLANKYNIPFCEVSAKRYINVNELFEDIINYIISDESKFLYNN